MESLTKTEHTNAFEFLGPRWKNPPLSNQLFRKILEFVSDNDFRSNENCPVIEGLASGFGTGPQELMSCLRQLENERDLDNKTEEFEQMFNGLVEKGDHHAIVLNARGEIEWVAISEERIEEFAVYVHEEMGGCHWIISLVQPGDVFSNENIQELREAIEGREYFYTEREKLYGPKAWPNRSH